MAKNSSSSSRLDATARVSRYTRQRGISSEGEVAPTGDKMTGPQRRRTIHKTSAQYGPGGPAYGMANADEHDAVRDPDRWAKTSKGKHAYLNPDQFRKLDDVKNYNAMDGYNTGHDLIPGKMEEIKRGEGDTRDYDALREAMRSGGPAGGKVPPIWVTGEQYHEPTIGNGGHRLALADNLGWKVIPVTRGRESSGYGDRRGFIKGPDDDDEYYGESSRHHWGNSAYGDTSGGYHSPAHIPGLVSPVSPAKFGRSHIPGNTGFSANNKGGRWHGWAGQDSGGQGLYTQLHGPAPDNTAAVRARKASIIGQEMDARGAGQQILPGMHQTGRLGRSDFDGRAHFTGGAAVHPGGYTGHSSASVGAHWTSMLESGRE